MACKYDDDDVTYARYATIRMECKIKNGVSLDITYEVMKRGGHTRMGNRRGQHLGGNIYKYIYNANILICTYITVEMYFETRIGILFILYKRCVFYH